MITRELIDQFRERANRNKYVLNKYRNIDGRNKWSCICSCMDWLSVAASYLSENPIPIQHSNDDLNSVNVYTYISCVDMVFEAIKQLHRIFVSENNLPFENDAYIFTENIYCKSDNDYFKLIRSCFGAHPVNLNDYFTSGDSKERRFASWSGGHFSRRDYGVILYSNRPGVKDIFFDISFSEIDAFLVRTYSYLSDLIKIIDEDEEATKRTLRAKIIQHSDSPVAQLQILSTANKGRYDNDYYDYVINELTLLFNVDITNPGNQPIVDCFKIAMTPAIAELKDLLQCMELEEVSAFEATNPSSATLPYSVQSGLAELSDSVFSHTHTYPIFQPALFEFISSIVAISGNESDEELYILAKAALYHLQQHQ